MKKVIFGSLVLITIIFWPISFIISNSHDWQIFFLAAIILAFDWFFYKRNFQFHYFFNLILPIIHPAFLFLPVSLLIFYFKEIKKTNALIIYLSILVFVSLFSFKSFYAYSIFTPDPLAQDTLIKKISIIPNRNLARIYENKTTVYQEKYKTNAFLFLDLNNYFFSMHPREITGENQNLQKYPFLAIFPFLYGLFLLPKHKDRKWVVSLFLSIVFSISFINNPDKFDLLLFIPISIISYIGINEFIAHHKKISIAIVPIFLTISLVELSRIIFLK